MKLLGFAFLLPLLWMLAAPVNDRSKISPKNLCLNPLRQIDGALEQVAAREGLASNTIVRTALIEAQLKPRLPSCPESGKYTFGVVGREAHCSIHTQPFRNR